MLRPDIVADGRCRKVRAIHGNGRRAGRRRQPVGEHIDADHTVFGWVETLAFPDQELIAGVIAGIPRAQQDGVVFAAVEFAIDLIGELCLAQNEATFERKIP